MWLKFTRGLYQKSLILVSIYSGSVLLAKIKIVLYWTVAEYLTRALHGEHFHMCTVTIAEIHVISLPSFFRGVVAFYQDPCSVLYNRFIPSCYCFFPILHKFLVSVLFFLGTWNPILWNLPLLSSILPGLRGGGIVHSFFWQLTFHCN